MTSTEWQAQLKQVINLIDNSRPEGMSEMQAREQRTEALEQLRQLFRDIPPTSDSPPPPCAAPPATTAATSTP